MYFRQYWMDKRLQYSNTGYSKRLAFNPQMLKFIWVPDTHFPGIKDGLKHDITDTNEVIRLWPNGSVLYSMRWVRTGYEHLFSRGREATWVNFCWVCVVGLSEPLPHHFLFLAKYRPHLGHFWEKCTFHDPNLVTFCSCMYLINPFNKAILIWLDTLFKLNVVKIFPF